MNTTFRVSEVKTNTTKTNSPIANRIKPENLKSNRQLDSDVVDFLLQDYADLIDIAYTGWFAKRFYIMSVDLIQRLASQARQDAKQDPKRLFAYLVKKSCNA